MDSLKVRFARLDPLIKRYGPDDEVPRPLLILFHGCGGLRPHITAYAKAVADALPIRAWVVDSFGPRGWDRTFATSLICTGVVLQGYERAGDVLSVLWGAHRDPTIDSEQIILSGFSHGGWSIMDLMTAPLLKAGEVKISDPDPALIDNLKGLFLVYPYAAFPAKTEHYDWQRQPDVFWVAAKKDHLTPLTKARSLIEKLKTQGVPVASLELDATHAFDEQGSGPIMHYSASAEQATREAMIAYCLNRFGLNDGRATPPAAPPGN